MNAEKLDVHEVHADELEGVLAEIEGKIAPHHFELISRAVTTLVWVFQSLEKEGVTLRLLRRLLLGRNRSTEKTDAVLGEQAPGQQTPADESPSQGEPKEESKEPRGDTEEIPNEDDGQEEEAEENKSEDRQDSEEKQKRKGHGRNGVAKYPGAERVPIPHPELKHGDPCPACFKGNVYLQKPRNILRIKGRSLLEAKVYQPERLRCGLCGELFQTELPPEAGEKTHDESAGSIISLLKYGSGMPFNRMEQLQDGFGVPLPASTQWDIVEQVSKKISPAYDALLERAAQGELFYNDDTGMKVLELPPDPDVPPDRTGIFTTGIVVKAGEHQIGLYFTGRKHAGERLNGLLDDREPDAPTPTQMSDALSRNTPQDHATHQAVCNSHGRRNFVKIVDSFPEQCDRVLKDYRAVYRNEARTKAQQMTPDERLRFHQKRSRPILEGLKKWMGRQFEEKLVEPNSGLGKAFNYMLNHWDKLTLFLRQPGAPLDNNICERALKVAIRHRKNSLFYKTENGARVGDLFMTLIHTCRLNRANPFDYLTELQKHQEQVKACPEAWMPWNFQATLDRLAASDIQPSSNQYTRAEVLDPISPRIQENRGFS